MIARDTLRFPGLRLKSFPCEQWRSILKLQSVKAYRRREDEARSRIRSLLAWLLCLGSWQSYAGGQVLLGRDPGYTVINWLVLYNYTVGVLRRFSFTVDTDLDK